MKTAKNNSTNFLQLYYAGGSYIISLSLPMVSLYGGGGLGYLWLNTQRTYGTRLGVATVNGQLVQLHGILGIEFFDPSGVSFALEGRYTHTTTVSPTRADLDFTMKGIDAGIRIGVPVTF
jgi:opacity protein-like surface antigen